MEAIMTKLNISLGSTALTAPQSLALSSAAERDGGGLVLPARLKGKAAQSLVAALIEKGLAREIRAKPGMPICRRDTATGRSYALVITKLGRTSIQPQQAEVISPETAAIKVVPVAKHDSSKMEAPATSTDPELCPASPTTSNAPRQGSKLAGVMALLFRETGASIEELTATTGWLPHTTRAALTGLRKRGYAILREKRDGKGSVYRIELMPSAEAA